MKKIFTSISILISAISFSQSTTVVISQMYGGGGGSTGTYINDYVELHNISNTTQDISGMSIAYGSNAGQFGSSSTNYFTFPASTTIAAGKYFLIQCGASGSAGAALPVTPDIVTTNVSASGSTGKMALVTASFTFNACGGSGSPCTLPNSTIVDLVSYGTANNAEGGGAAANNGVALTSTQGCVRKNNGCTDTDNNNADFDIVSAPVPRNSASTVVNCTLLPLSLTSFNASLINSSVQMNWNTYNEVNVNNFLIERSIDGRNFASVGTEAAKNSVGNNSYSYTDIKPLSGVSYYRLKIIDKDASYKYSQVVVINNKASINVEVFPNPVVNSVTISHPKAIAGAVIRIISPMGNVLQTVPVQVGSIQTGMEVSSLQKGNYILVFDNNGERRTTKIVKQ